MNKWYIGITNDVQRRYHEHLFSNGCLWTSMYRPIKIEQIIPTDTNFDEDKYTKIYMNKYGIDNVRGASYVQMELSDEQKNMLIQEFRGVGNCCFRCGKHGHFINTCDAMFVDSVVRTPKRRNEENFVMNKKRRCHVDCQRCGRDSHTTEECFATFDVNGDEIDDEDDEDDEDNEDDVCIRCGRDSHSVKNCFAKYDVDGDYIDE